MSGIVDAPLVRGKLSPSALFMNRYSHMLVAYASLVQHLFGSAPCPRGKTGN